VQLCVMESRQVKFGRQDRGTFGLSVLCTSVAFVLGGLRAGLRPLKRRTESADDKLPLASSLEAAGRSLWGLSAV